MMKYNYLTLFFILFFSFDTFAQRILIVSPEQSEIFQTGGLAHATTGLASALSAEGLKTDVLMPYYSEMNASALENLHQRFEVPLDWSNGRPHKTSYFTLHQNADSLNRTLFLKHEHGDHINYFSNPSGGGKKYYGPEFSIGEAVGAWAKASADYILSQDYDVVVLNDWTTGLISFYLHLAKLQGKKVPKVIFAVHNLAYQGVFPESLAKFLGIPNEFFNLEGVEYYSRLSMLKSGLQFSDLIYTVSPQYAQEITTQRFGVGLDGLMRAKKSQNKLVGILNGIDNLEWDPRRPQKGLNYEFSSQDFRGKALGKAELQNALNLPQNPNTPIFIFTSRLAEQKGIAYLPDAIAMAAAHSESQFVISGDGDPAIVARFHELEQQFPNQIRFRGFSSILEKQLTRYGDFFVNASWFEPSGLNQLFAMRQGTLPVVSAAGGLIDSVKDGETGLLFPIIPNQHNGDTAYDVAETKNSVAAALIRACDLFRDKKKMRKMQVRAMQEDNSWQNRVRSEMKPLLEYVLTEGHLKTDFLEWKAQRPVQSTQELSCRDLFVRGS